MPSKKPNKPPLKLYTKTGDKGVSSPIAGTRLPKHHSLFEVLGTIDELNASLGLAKSVIDLKSAKSDKPSKSEDFLTTTHSELSQIQDSLLTTGAIIAGSTKVTLKPNLTDWLEQRIDYYQAHTRDDWFTQFLLPGGTPLAAHLDLSRTICRRLERRLSKLSSLGQLEQLPARSDSVSVSGGKIRNLATTQAFINRLSDYLFAARCFINSKQGYQETTFSPSKNQ